MEDKEKVLTDKQKSILTFIQSKIEHDGFPPSIREICNAVGLSSSSSVHGQLIKLEQQGYIQVGHGKSRAIKVLKMTA